MAHFQDVKSSKGLSELNDFLAHNSFVTGHTLSAFDASVFESVHSCPPSAQYPHISRWYKNIDSYNHEHRSAWPQASSYSDAFATCVNGAVEAKDDDFDLFGSDEEDDAEKERIKEERLKAYAEKKAKKPGPIAKSNIIFDVKPWDDTIDLQQIETSVRAITTDGLVWGASKVLPVAYGIKKLQIMSVIEDDKVSTDWLEEAITELEDLVQSVDIVAFNKV